MNDLAVKMDLVLSRLDEIARQLDGKVSTPWFNIQQAASYLKCSVSSIDRMSRRGVLPFHRQDPTSARSPRLYHRRELTAFLVTGRSPRSHRLSPAEKRLVEELL